LGTGPFFGLETLFADKTLAENMDLSPLEAHLEVQRGQSHFRGEYACTTDNAQCAAKIGTVPCADSSTK